MIELISRRRVDAFISIFVTVHPHEIPALLHSSSCFFFILCAYFVVLPLRDEGAISLGLSHLPGLFIGSLLLTLIAAPVSTLIFSLPNLSKVKALVLIHRFFSVSLVVFFILWHTSSTESLQSQTKDSVALSTELKVNIDQASPSPADSIGWGNHSWFYVSVRIGLFLWIALLNLITISSTWARVIDIMDNESGSRLFGFIGAGATLGQLFGSLFATGMAWLGSFLLLFAAILMELAARSSIGISKDIGHLPEELSPIRKADLDQENDADDRQAGSTLKVSSPKSNTSTVKPQLSAILDGLRLILSSTYLLHVSLFLWLSAVVSSFFYFQKVNVIAMTVASAVGRRRLFAQINSFIAVFILTGQLTLTGRILTVAGVTIALCFTPFVAFSNLVAVAIWPTWIVVAISETLRKVVNYVVTKPGRELLFTVVSEDEKYKAKICIDVIVQRLGDATAAGIYKLLFSILNGRISTVSLYTLPFIVYYVYASPMVSSSSLSAEEDLELERQLKVLNKPPIKTFKVVQLGMKEGPIYYGIYGDVDAYNLSVPDQQFSSANLWVQNGPVDKLDQLNVILGGWAVSPNLNGDSLTRLFTYWFGDHETGNWWCAISDWKTFVGYWPKELLHKLSNGANYVAWGGIAIADKQGNSPPMGSGHYPNNDYTCSCFFKSVKFMNYLSFLTPDNNATIQYIDKSGCYDLLDKKNCGYKKMRYCFTFGGPGGKCG
ncbi:hypothetical protein COLO4_10038 [Corchorus olitorius]|uniref:Neprosin PEP catalytic domain-containing protein n=1 Tax=Corchorus olitorius TaxID=93759 RepID=A0A1R3KA80_9ROSI|nr:hypothetical protein COLO4_10038 [Corchorus olitorius]